MVTLSRRKGLLCIKRHFPTKTCLRLSTMVDIVTKGKICLGVLSFCFNADYLSINLTSLLSDYLSSLPTPGG